jgi:hypothetical protein
VPLLLAMCRQQASSRYFPGAATASGPQLQPFPRVRPEIALPTPPGARRSIGQAVGQGLPLALVIPDAWVEPLGVVLS